MGTLVTLSDGSPVQLDRRFEDIVQVVADARDQAGSITDPDGRAVPRAFLVWTDREGRKAVVNADQIVAIQPGD